MSQEIERHHRRIQEEKKANYAANLTITVVILFTKHPKTCSLLINEMEREKAVRGKLIWELFINDVNHSLKSLMIATIKGHKEKKEKKQHVDLPSRSAFVSSESRDLRFILIMNLLCKLLCIIKST
ncbi:CLUMA_CG019683, isoform A [Clunio marinus]|uniref:CLUMA_CG019683, isoform A n=1 Tax=Clunio marinus TaxID=568069 RepID=A0A1J1J4C5_9DIPT|nr:CLUMA_CG019683, isoform A [Clunio marinus]